MSLKYTPHPTLYTLHTKPYALNPNPFTLNPQPQPLLTQTLKAETWNPKPEPETQPLRPSTLFSFFVSLVTGPRRSLSLKLSDTRVYAPQVRAHLGTTAHLCKVVQPYSQNSGSKPVAGTVRTGPWTGPPRGVRSTRVGISSTVFGVRACKGLYLPEGILAASEEPPPNPPILPVKSRDSPPFQPLQGYLAHKKPRPLRTLK